LKTELKREQLSAAGQRFAVVVSRWNDEFTSKLVDGATEALKERGATDDAIETFYVPGAFELPLAALKAAESGYFGAVIAIGVIIRGDTPHFEYVSQQAAAGILQASLKTGVPVMFGVITADNVEQVHERCGANADNKGYEAALSGVEMAHLMSDMRSRDERRFEELLASLNDV